MRHDLYIDSYRRYKRGTAKIAQWLANAGRLCGAHLDSANFTLKGKYLMPLSKFRELADAIAKSTDPEIDIKPEVLDILREVISLRKAATVFFRHNSSSNELFEQSNEGHLYTIEVLEDVLALLAPLRQTERSARPAQPEAETTDAAIQQNGIFDVLDLEDIEEPVVHQELVVGSKNRQSKSKTKARSKAQNDTFELGSTNEDLFFTLFCFFKDLHETQAYLHEIWKGYKDGHMSLTSVAVTTDLAFDVVKRKENEMLQTEWIDAADGSEMTLKDVFANLQKTRSDSAVPLYWLQQNPRSLLNHGYLGELLYSYVSSLNGHNIVGSGDGEEPFQSRMYHIANWLFTPAYIMLNFADVLSGGSDLQGEPQTATSNFKKENGATAVRSVKQFEKEFKNLMRHVGELMRLRGAGLDKDLTNDVWTAAMCNLIDPHKSDSKKRMGDRNNRQARNTIPVWLAFATTIYIDIRAILGSGVGRAFQELSRESIRASRTIDRMLKWCRHHPDAAWTRQHVQVMEQVQQTLKTHIEEDPVAKINALAGLPPAPNQSPHFLLRSHPLWAGVALFWMQLSMWDATIEMMNIYAGVCHATHLYALALTKEQFAWPDLEYLIKLHGSEYLFYGGRPTTAAESFKKFTLSQGVSAQASAKGRHSKRNISARGPQLAVRQHRPYTIRSDLLNWRYNAVRMRRGPPEGPQTTLPALELLLEFQKRKVGQDIVRKDGNSAYLIPLLAVVQKALSEDVKHLAFDYFAMHERCWNLLERLQVKLHTGLLSFGQITGQNLLQKDQSTLRMMVIAIFNCVEIFSDGRSINPQIASMARMVLDASDVFKKLATEEGSTGLDMVQEALDAKAGAPELSDDTDIVHDDGDSNIDPKDMEMLSSFLDMAPKRLVTDEEAKLALKKAKKMSRNEMSPAMREYIDYIESNGADLSRNGLQALLTAGFNTTSQFTTEQQERVLQTTTLEEYMSLIKSFENSAGNLTDSATANGMTAEKKKRNNKNKNKNRKLKQKEQKASGAVDGERSDHNLEKSPTPSGSSSRAMQLERSLLEVVTQTPIKGKKYWLTTGPKTQEEFDAYEQARRNDVMTIDGEEIYFTGRTERDIDIKDLSDEQLTALMKVMALKPGFANGGNILRLLG